MGRKKPGEMEISNAERWLELYTIRISHNADSKIN